MSYGDFDPAIGVNRGFGLTIVDDLLVERKGYAEGPERALLSALLFDGIQSYIRYILASSPTIRLHYYEAYRWVTDRRTDDIFAFSNVCEALGINPDYLRCGLANTSARSLAETGKTRRKF